MATLPILSGREAARIFQKFGRTEARRRGSHMILTKPGEIATLSIPDHDEIAKGTLRSLIRAANMTTDEFLSAISRE